MSTITSARRRARLGLGVVAGAALALALPLAASAHVHVTPEEAAADGTTRLDFSFSHGCDGAATTAIVIDIPDAAQGAAPIVDGAWAITTEVGQSGIPTTITYTATTPVTDGFAASVGMNVIFPASAEGESFAFPVTQQCEGAESAWVEVAEAGEDAHDLDYPAPVVTVTGASDASGDGHGGHGDGTESSQTEASAADESSAADPLPIWLSAGALVVAAAALVLTIARRRA